jgi:hypothetical protein
MVSMPIENTTEMLASRGFLPYDPGSLPTDAPPVPGDSLSLSLPGFPPCKELGRSLRNVEHPRYNAFVALRRAATEAMRGRAWYRGPIRLDVILYAPSLPENRKLIDYIGGIMDSLDGSHGFTFTYLPIIYEDDCQVTDGRHQFVQSTSERYDVHVVFLPDGA